MLGDLMDRDIYDLPVRIKKIYEASTEEEKFYLRKILEELSTSGYSQTYEQIWLHDYIEIPVDIETFLCSDLYLGKSNSNGTSIYPSWHKAMSDIFNAGNKWEEVFFTGATRIGKSTTAVSCMAYMLYKLMCLRDPQKYFQKKEISKFTVSFFNVTKDLAKGVAFKEFQDTLRVSPWFNQHGSFSRSENNYYYIPNGGKVEVSYGSDAAHALGQQVFCLVGNTLIKTSDGWKSLESLINSYSEIYQYDFDDESYNTCSAEIIQTKYVSDTIRITLEDGTVIEGTPEHKILLSNGEYKMLGELSNSDNLLALNKEFDGHLKSLASIKVHNIEQIHYDSPIPVYDVINAVPNHNFIVKGNSCQIVAHNCAMMDEINFSRAGIKDVSKAKAHMKDTYNTVVARVKGTFRMHGEVYGKVFAVSSKRTDSDFMEAYLEDQIQAGASDHIYIFDKPQWEVLPESTFSKEKFYLAVGDRYKKGFVVPDNQTSEESLADIRQQGYRILTPPIDMKSQFLADYDIALRDLAGISVAGTLSFITQDSLDAVINKERKNPFFSDVLSIGTKDSLTIEEFFHIEVIPKEILNADWFLHLDLSLNTDRTGMGASCVTSRKDIKTDDGKIVSMPFISHAFSVAIEAPRGDKIPYSKIVAFICWLRKRGINVKLITRDQFQSEYLAQILEAQGFDTAKISLDRTPDGYMATRSVILEQRIDMLDVKLLQDELVFLQRDGVTGKIDHLVGKSKDVADGFAGSVWSCIQHCPNVKIPAKSVVNAITNVNLGNRLFPNAPKGPMPSIFGNGYRKF